MLSEFVMTESPLVMDLDLGDDLDDKEDDDDEDEEEEGLDSARFGEEEEEPEQ